MATKRKRLVRGKDYDGWVQTLLDGTYSTCVYPTKPRVPIIRGTRFVRVKFVEVDS